MGEYGLDDVDDRITAKQVMDGYENYVRYKTMRRKKFVSEAKKYYFRPDRVLLRFIRKCLGKQVTSYQEYMNHIEAMATLAWGKEQE